MLHIYVGHSIAQRDLLRYVYMYMITYRNQRNYGVKSQQLSARCIAYCFHVLGELCSPVGKVVPLGLRGVITANDDNHVGCMTKSMLLAL